MFEVGDYQTRFLNGVGFSPIVFLKARLPGAVAASPDRKGLLQDSLAAWPVRGSLKKAAALTGPRSTLTAVVSTYQSDSGAHTNPYAKSGNFDSQSPRRGCFCLMGRWAAGIRSCVSAGLVLPQ